MTKKQRVIYWLAATLIVATAIGLLIKIVASPAQDIAPDKITKEDWTRGNPDAKVILIEYSDFQCPACRYYYQMTEPVFNEFRNHIYFAYRHFPLSYHKNAEPAARATEAAGLQDKFWEMYEILFDDQNEWANLDNPQEQFAKYAENLSLDKENFIEDYNSSKVKNAVEVDSQNAKKLELRGTPSFFLNGQLINNIGGYESFRELIRNTVDKNS